MILLSAGHTRLAFVIARCNIHGVTSSSFSYDAERGFIEMDKSRSAGKRLTCMTRLTILLIEGMRVKP